MSAPSESAATPAPCACTNISLMQLFHELKQKFPGVPDHVVSNTIELYCHDKQACETHLHSEVKASLTHTYHASSVAAARHLNQLKINPPGKCKNQSIVKHDGIKLIPIQSIICQGPQTAVLSSNLASDEDKENKLHTDNNQNIVNVNKENLTNKLPSPVTEINIDNCYAKYYAESSSDFELTNENLKESTNDVQNEYIRDSVKSLELNEVQPDLSESTNYKILKSSKVKSNLHEKLEKKTINKSELEHLTEDPVLPVKPKRPNTLDFIKPNPDLAFKQTSIENKQPSPTNSPAQKVSSSHAKETKASQSPKQEKFPLNFSVNVNCHMDLSRGYSDPWLEDYDSPRAITSVNLTVCTPTSNMASPVRDVREGDDGGFEGHVTVTVSPSTTRPLRRRAPAPPPAPQATRLESPRPTRAAPEPPPGLRHDRSLIERQKERLSRLATALSQEQGRLAQLNKERKILSAPPPSPASAQMLRDDVERLRDMCDSLAKRLESIGSEPVDSDSFYSNIYTGQQPPSSWQCHLCTFRNHPLLDTCEGCDMRRIFVGTSPSSTHDSGFGSFRDRNRRGALNTNVDSPVSSNLHEDRRALLN